MATEATIRVKVGENWLEVKASSPLEAHAAISRFSEILSEPHCRLCKSGYRYNVRKAANAAGKQFTFYELVCLNPECRARLQFGQTNDDPNILFPKRKDDQGNWDFRYGGWQKFRTEKMEDPAPQPKPATRQDEIPF